MEGKIAISEGSDVHGSDGTHGGRVEAVGAKYVTIAAGLLGQKEFHLPLALIDAQARAFKDIPPPDEPIYHEPRPLPAEEMGAVGIPVDGREEFGMGTR